MKLMKNKVFQWVGKQSFPKQSKKAVELSLNTVIIAAILLVTIIVIISVFTKLIGKETDQISDQIDSLDDEDDDGIINMFDKCPCEQGTKDDSGCPVGVDPPKPKPKSC